MGYQALYRRYRPARFEDFVGQEAVIKTLRSQITSGRIAHAYLFCGTRGTGKTSTAKVFARAVNCEHPENGDPCGTCDTCRALAEDIVRGQATKHYCSHILRDHIHTLSDTCASMIADVVSKDQKCSQERIQELAGQLDQLNTEITMMDVGHRPIIRPPEEGGNQDDHS